MHPMPTTLLRLLSFLTRGFPLDMMLKRRSVERRIFAAISGCRCHGRSRFGALLTLIALGFGVGSPAVHAQADTQAPAIPTGLTATAVSSSQILLSWNASTDNVGVTGYKVYQDGSVTATITAPTHTYAVMVLSPSTIYSYRVAACDAANNCSAQSAAASATTLVAGNSSFTPALNPGFNLLGNSLNTILNVASLFGNQTSPVAGITSNIVSVWKWNAASGRWAFYSPQLTVAGNFDYVGSPRNYELLDTINPGEGYWVNAITAVTLPVQSGTNFTWNVFNFPNLIPGFNLIADASSSTPSQFNIDTSAAQPPSGVVATDSLVSLWGWDTVRGNWYFYSPLLEASGGLPAVKAYADSRAFLHFQDYGKTLDTGTGFWVNVTTAGSSTVAASTTVGSAGGSLAVTDPTSSLAGTQVLIPAQALLAPVILSIAKVQNSPLIPPGIPAVQIDMAPAGPLAGSVTIVLPYNSATLAKWGVADETRQSIFAFNEKTLLWEQLPSTVDTTRKVVVAQTPHLSLFALVPLYYAARKFGILDAFQPRSLQVVKVFPIFPAPPRTGFVAPDPLMAACDISPERNVAVSSQRNVLLIHGALSSMNGFQGDNDLIAYARSKYHNVLFYNYPSAGSIDENAQALALWIASNERGLFPNGAHFDIIAHSMGGLVARSLMEKHFAALASRGLVIDRIVTLGTPHYGGRPIDALSAALSVPFGITDLITSYRPLYDLLNVRGVVDMTPGSEFLDSLNGGPTIPSNKPSDPPLYYAIAGNIGLEYSLAIPGTGISFLVGNSELFDKFVPIGSALGALKMGAHLKGTQTFLGLDHFALHEGMLQNGVADQIDSWLTTQDRVVYTSIRQLQVNADGSLHLQAQALDVASNGFELGSTAFQWASVPPGSATVVINADGTADVQLGPNTVCITAEPTPYLAKNNDIAKGGLVMRTVNLTVDKVGANTDHHPRSDSKVRSTPVGIDCGSTCTSRFEAGVGVTLIAGETPGERFVNWSGACSGSGSCTVQMDGAKTVTAHYEPLQMARGGAVSSSGHLGFPEHVIVERTQPNTSTSFEMNAFAPEIFSADGVGRGGPSTTLVNYDGNGAISITAANSGGKSTPSRTDGYVSLINNFAVASDSLAPGTPISLSMQMDVSGDLSVNGSFSNNALIVGVDLSFLSRSPGRAATLLIPSLDARWDYLCDDPNDPYPYLCAPADDVYVTSLTSNTITFGLDHESPILLAAPGTVKSRVLQAAATLEMSPLTVNFVVPMGEQFQLFITIRGTSTSAAAIARIRLRSIQFGPLAPGVVLNRIAGPIE